MYLQMLEAFSNKLQHPSFRACCKAGGRAGRQASGGRMSLLFVAQVHTVRRMYEPASPTHQDIQAA